jgi:hypothetical protein
MNVYDLKFGITVSNPVGAQSKKDTCTFSCVSVFFVLAGFCAGY